MFLVNGVLFAQYKIEWDRYIGNDYFEVASDIIQTSDGNFLILGLKKYDKEGLWLVKLTPGGKLIWSRKYYGYRIIHPKRVIETRDKGLLIVSQVAEKEKEPYNIWLLRLNTGGDIIWERLYEGLGDVSPTSAIETYDRGFVIAGYSAYKDSIDIDWYIMKVDSLGFFSWDNSFGTPHDDRILDVAQLPDSSLVFVGYTSYNKGALKRAAIYITDRLGRDLNFIEFENLRWSKATTVFANQDTTFVTAIEYIPKNQTQLNAMLVIKYDENLNVFWERKIVKNAMCHPVKIIGTFDDGFALIYTMKQDGEFHYNVAVVKLNPFGQIVWERVFRRKSNDYAASLIEGKDNALYVISTTYSIDNGWNYGIARFKSLEYTRLKIIFPRPKIITVLNDTMLIKGCLKSFKKPKKLVVLLNKDTVSVLKSFKKIDSANCDFSFVLKVPLHYGENVLLLRLIDYKDYIFSESRKIYYLPPPAIHW